MTTLDLDDAQARLREVVAGLRPGEEVVLTANGREPAKLVKTAPDELAVQGRVGEGKILYIAPDFDAPLEEFKEYME